MTGADPPPPSTSPLARPLTGAGSRRSGPPRQRSAIRRGAATTSIASCSRDWKTPASPPPRRPRRPHSPAGPARCSPVSRLIPRPSRPSWPTPTRGRSRRMSIACSPRRTLASGSRGTGSMSCGMPRPAATSSTSRSQMPGGIATGWSRPSTTTCPTTSSSASRSPATSSIRRGSIRSLVPIAPSSAPDSGCSARRCTGR